MSLFRSLSTLTFAILMLNGCGGGCDHCSQRTYAIGGAISGLVGSRLALSNNGATVSIAPGLNGRVPDIFSGLPNGASYDITVATQPTTPSQTCVVTNGKGTIANADVANISVTCTTTPARLLLGQGDGSCMEASAIDRTTGALAPTTASPLCAIHDDKGNLWGYPLGPIAADPQGRFLYIAIPQGQVGPLVTLAIDHSSGALTFVEGRNVVEAGDVAVDPSGKFLFVTDTGPGGTSGGIVSCMINSTSGALTCDEYYSFHDGSPDFMQVDPLGRFVYVEFTELSSRRQRVMSLSLDSKTGVLSSMAPPVAVVSGWMVADPAGRFLYVENRTSNSITTFNVDPANGALNSVADLPFEAADESFSAAIDPAGNYLYVTNFVSNDISAYAIERRSGRLTPINGSPFPTRQVPTSITIEPQGRFLYVSSAIFVPGNAGVSAYEIDGANGALTPISGSPFTFAFGFRGITIY